MYIFELIAKRKIREAMDRGEFDNNPLAGKPLPKDHLENVPPDLRMAYKILKNANIIPEEIELKKRINSLEDMIRVCEFDDDKTALQLELNEKQLRYSLIMERRLGRPIDPKYSGKVASRFRK